jgi:CheY-like chemotaxis protein
MDAHTQQHLFEPFFTTKEVGKGTGLGLSSVYAAVQKFGGRIFVKSRLGEGTAFSIYLPRCEQPNARPVERSGSRDCVGGTESILLVEDEPAVRRIARDVLQRAGYHVSEASNGAEALARYGDDLERFDLLVTDVVMPLMNGVRLAEEMRQRRPELKVLFISGHAEDVLAGRAVDAVASHFLPKPFHPDMLAHKVRAVLDEAGESRKTAAGG